jgi:hypothetical protein
MTEEQKQALMNALDYLWAYGADQHPAPARGIWHGEKGIRELRDTFI